MRLPKDFIEQVHAYDQLGPNEEITRELKAKIIIPIIGPTAVGKSTLIDGAHKINAAFSAVRSFTTRSQRPGEPADSYEFLSATRDTVEQLSAKMATRNLVQITMHPNKRDIYGSELAAYPTRYNMLATLSGAVEGLRRLPFGACLPIAIATKPEIWHEWFMQRYHQTCNLQEGRGRLREARESLEWCLSNANYDVLWLQNTGTRPEDSADNIICAAYGDLDSDPAARKLGEAMLRSIPELESHLKRRAA